jgi:hypothetical protein
MNSPVTDTWTGPNMYRARAQARRYAQLVKLYEDNAMIGAWSAWQAYIDQWGLRDPIRQALNQIFDRELLELDIGGKEPDGTFDDVW